MVIAERPVLSLAELELHDANPSGHGAERRFLCPFAACADHQRREHKNLAANIESGLWACKRCGASGKLTEKWEQRQPVRPTRVLRLGPYEKARRAMGLAGTPAGSSQHAHVGTTTQVVERNVDTGTPPGVESDVDEHLSASARERVPAWRRRWEHAVPVAGTPGETYLASRGIPLHIATAAGVRYLERWEHWTRDEHGDWHLEGSSRRVVFPIVDRVGEQIGIQGRKIVDGEHGEKMLTNGHGGIFAAGTAWPLTEQLERVAVVEAPIDALSLAAAGMVALATQGTSWPEWLPLALAFKKVLLAQDNDAPDVAGERAGDLAAASMVPALRSYGAEPERLRPKSKDWNQDLQELGLEQVRRVIYGDRAIAPLAATTTAEAPVEAGPAAPTSQARASATSERSGESTVETSCAGAEPIAAGERAEVEELLGWLQSADLPSAPVRLWPWVSVADMPRFVGRLQAELSAPVVGPGWRAAAEDLRQLARLYHGPASEGCGSAGLGRAPPMDWPPSATSTRLTATPQVVADAGAAGSSVG
ncbi:MAG: toprim domain-containing protein [Chloroflexi bacterium]|nr:toprim domain-containing protein [Chloroflexota bacterium]MBV9602670.1 toprim domain-containing protein [Chloroflexota bacterium]